MNRAIALTLALYAGLAFFLSQRFPPVSPDEVLVTVHGYNQVRGEGQRYSLYDDLFAPDLYALRDAFVEVTRPVHDAWVGVFVALHRRYETARASSWLAGLLGITFLFLFARHLWGPKVALATAVALLATPVFWVGSVLVRPETLVLAMSALMIWALTLKPHPWTDFGIGLVGGLAVGAHPNVIPFFGGMVLLDWMLHPGSRGVGRVLRLAAGFAAGFLLVFGMIHMERFRLSRQTFQYEFAKPPIFSAFQPWAWIRGTWVTLTQGPTYYFDPQLVPGWTKSLVFYWVAVIMAGLRLLWLPHTEARGIQALWAGLGVTLFGLVLLVSRQEVLYVLTLQPFLAPLLGRALAPASKPEKILPRLLQGFTLLASIASLVSFVLFVNRYQDLCKAPAKILNEFRQIVPDDSLRVAGPNVFWYAQKHVAFRDLGAFTISRYYTRGAWNAREWLGRWRPQVIVLDAAFRRNFLKNAEAGPLLQELLNEKVTPLGVLETGAAYGRLDLYRIEWRP